MATATKSRPRLEPEIDSEPSYNQLRLALGDFEDARDALSIVRWPVASRDPRIKVVETLRAAIRDLAQQAVAVLQATTAPPGAGAGEHWNDRPEDCPCPACRNQVDLWARRHGVTLTEADLHPKANPHLSLRELHRLHQD